MFNRKGEKLYIREGALFRRNIVLALSYFTITVSSTSEFQHQLNFVENLFNILLIKKLRYGKMCLKVNEELFQGNQLPFPLLSFSVGSTLI